MEPTNTHSEKTKEWDQNTFTALLAENILIKTHREEERERDRQRQTDRQTDRGREKNTQRSLHITNPKAQACAYDYE